MKIDSHYILSIAFIIACILLLSMQALLSRSLGKKFDNLLIKANLSLPISSNFLLPQKWGRTGLYASMIAWNISPENKNSFRYKNYKKRFSDFYFREHASKIEVIQSKIYASLIITNAIILFYFIYLGFSSH